MKAIFVPGIALVTVLASTAFAAPPKHRVPLARDDMSSYGQNAGDRSFARGSDVVIEGNRVIGQDPDPNVRAQLLKDSAVSDY